MLELQDSLSLKGEEGDSEVIEELHDMSQWIVEIPSISIQQDPALSKRVSYSFQIKVYRSYRSGDSCTSVYDADPEA